MKRWLMGWLAVTIALASVACGSTPAEENTQTTITTTTTTMATTATTTTTTTTTYPTTLTPTIRTTTTTKTTTKRTTTATAVTPTHTEMETEIFRLLNAERTKAGLPPVKLNTLYHACAEVRAEECSVTWNHVRPNGKDFSSVFEELNLIPYGYSVAENLGRKFTSADSLHKAWVDSPAHYSNMMLPDVTEVAIAVYADDSGTLHACELFLIPPQEEP